MTAAQYEDDYAKAARDVVPASVIMLCVAGLTLQQIGSLTTLGKIILSLAFLGMGGAAGIALWKPKMALGPRVCRVLFAFGFVAYTLFVILLVAFG